MADTTTFQPQSTGISPDHARVVLSRADRVALSNDFAQALDESLNARHNLERNLQDWLDLYEMKTAGQMDDPWPDASNVTPPIVPAQLDTAQAYIVARTLVPRFYIVSGNTEQAQTQSYLVERFYNAEFRRQRGTQTWYDRHVSWLALGLRDGTGVMEALWRKTKRTKRVKVQEPKFEGGVPVMDPSKATPTPIFETHVHEIEVTEYNDVELRPVKLKDIGLIPSTAGSIQEARAVWRVVWLYESDIREMQASGDGEFFDDAIERVYAYSANGAQTDVAADRQGSEDKTAGGQVQVSAETTQTSRFFVNRGPFKFFRIHTNGHNMHGTREKEENIFFQHELSREMIGWMPYDYLTDERPFFAFSPLPREGEFPGYSMAERLAMLQGEYAKIFNDRNNAVDIRVDPPMFIPAGTELVDGDQTWAPGVRWEGTAKPEPIQMSDIPVAAFQQGSEIMKMIEMVTGQAQPQLGTQSSGRRTATENRQQAAATGTRNDLIAIRFRIACRALINFVHKLKLQYMDEAAPPQVRIEDKLFTLPKSTLSLDLAIDVSGATDPVDAGSRLNQDMGIFQLMMKTPLIAQDPAKQLAWMRKICESAGYTDVNTLIGTLEELQQKMQQAAQQPGASQPGQPAPGGQQPQGGPPPQAPA